MRRAVQREAARLHPLRVWLSCSRGQSGSITCISPRDVSIAQGVTLEPHDVRHPVLFGGVLLRNCDASAWRKHTRFKAERRAMVEQHRILVLLGEPTSKQCAG